MDEIKNHFNEIAADYDLWKKKNWYYYENLKRLVRLHIPDGKNVLEIGTGTGDILASLSPDIGIGIDISQKMIEVAQEKYNNCKNLQFYNMQIEDGKWDVNFDYFILIDVIEHVENIEVLIESMGNKINKQKTKIFISMANPLWEPVLMMLEKLKLKMPEGKHYRISTTRLIDFFRSCGFEIETHNFSLLIPVYIPLLSNFLNSWFWKIPFLKYLGLIEYSIFISSSINNSGNQG